MSKNIDINNLGTFANIAAVWAAYPEGGYEGDYLYIGSTKYRWNKYNLLWENAATYTESAARKLTELYADVTVNNNLYVGGTLYYHRLKGYDLGLFSTIESLEAAYPSPEVGMWAFVVHPTIDDKYQIYVCSTEGEWTLSVAETTLDILDFENYQETLAMMQQLANGAQLAGYRAALSLNDLPLTDVDPTLGWIVGNHLYVWVGEGGDVLDGKYKDCGELRGAKGDKGDKGDNGVVLEGVTVFNALDDLEDKTVAQKEEMVPDGNMTETVANTANDASFWLHGSERDVKSDIDTSNPGTNYIDGSGKYRQHGSTSMWRITNTKNGKYDEGYTHVKVYGNVYEIPSGAVDGFSIISFYNGSSYTVVESAVKTSGDSNNAWYEADVPSDTTSIVICFKPKNSTYLSQVKIICTRSYEGQGIVSDVTALEDTMADITSDFDKKIYDHVSMELSLAEKREVPDYWFDRPEELTVDDYNSYMERKIQSVPDGKRFIFITDTHWKYNAKKSPSILNYVRKRTGVPFVVFGGDAIHRPAQVETESSAGSGIWTIDVNHFVTPQESAVKAHEELSEYCTLMKERFGDHFVFVTGNHDLGLANIENSGWSSSDKEAARVSYQAIVREAHSSIKGRAVYDEDGLANVDTLEITDEQKAELKAYIKQCYYVDDNTNKLRIIVTYTGMGNDLDGIVYSLFGLGASKCLCTQMKFIGTALITLPRGYDVVVAGHYFASSSSVFGGTSWLMDLFYAYRKKNSYTVTYPSESKALYTTWLYKSSRVRDFRKLSHYGRLFFIEGHMHTDSSQVMTYTDRNHASIETYNTGGYPYSETEATRLKQFLLLTVRRDGIKPEGQESRSSIPATTSVGGNIEEDCSFNVMSVTDDHHVISTRFGYGIDRDCLLPESTPPNEEEESEE